MRYPFPSEQKLCNLKLRLKLNWLGSNIKAVHDILLDYSPTVKLARGLSMGV